MFVERFSDSFEWNGKKYWVFPSYERISRLSPPDLADIKMTVKKSEYIIGIAKLMASGELRNKKLLSKAQKENQRKGILRFSLNLATSVREIEEAPLLYREAPST